MTRRLEGYGGPGEAAPADGPDADSPANALAGCEAAGYLGDTDFDRRDAETARTFARAAADVGLRRIGYHGGLGDDADDLSAHLRSRREVAGLLGSDGVPVTTLRAGILVGRGGISWETTRLLAALGERARAARA